MKPTPKGWPRISSSVFYTDPNAAIAWLGKAFGFEPRIVVPDGKGGVEHSELTYGDGVIMVSTAPALATPPTGKHLTMRSPNQVDGANTQRLFMYVDDVAAHAKRAEAAGATIVNALRENDYGAEYWSDRSYECRDLEGHHWYFSQRIRNPPGE